MCIISADVIFSYWLRSISGRVSSLVIIIIKAVAVVSESHNSNHLYFYDSYKLYDFIFHVSLL